MKKSKLLLVSVLTVVLCIVCVMSSASTTFSWFTRPRTLTGDKLQLPGQTYEIANGKNIRFTTYESTDGGENYGSTPVTSFSNTALAPHTRKMYRTDIANSGSNPQSVSLFLNNLKIGAGAGEFYLGVNSPLKTYKPYGKSATGSGSLIEAKAEDCVKNIYVGFASDSGVDVSKFYLHYWNDNGLADDAPVSTTTVGSGSYNPSDCGKSSHNASIDFTMYVATIPSQATGVKLKYKNGNDVWDGYDGGDNTDLVNKNTVLFYRWSDGDNGSNKDHTCYGTSDTPAGISKYYSSARVKVGNKIDVTPTSSGGSVTYVSSNPSVASVTDVNTGNIKGLKSGIATITMTVYGKEYSDKIVKSITVNVYSESSDDQSFVPVVTNVRVPGASADGAASVESVFWYIKNDSDTTLSYTIGSLDLTL